MSQLKIIGLQTGLPRTLGKADAMEPMDREWVTGFFKEAADDVRQVTRLGIEGDGQADLVHHGGPDKAINVYPGEHYAGWAEELGLALYAGAFGENFTVGAGSLMSRDLPANAPAVANVCRVRDGTRTYSESTRTDLV